MSSAASSDLPTREEFAPQVVKILKGNLGSLVEKVFAGEVTLFDPDVEWVDANDDQQGDIVLSVVLSPSDESLQLMREKERIGIWTGRQNQLSSLGTIIQRHSDDTERVYDTLFPTTFEADKAKTKIQQASSSLLPTDFVEERTKLKEAHDRIDPNAYPAVSEYIDKTLERIDAMEELQQANLSDLISIYGSRQGAEEEAKAFKVNRSESNNSTVLPSSSGGAGRTNRMTLNERSPYQVSSMQPSHLHRRYRHPQSPAHFSTSNEDADYLNGLYS